MSWDQMRRFLARENTWLDDQHFASKLILDKTVWTDMRCTLSASKLPASNYPAWTQLADNGSGSTGIFGYSFDDGEYVFVETQFAHSRKVGTNVHPHVHFYVTSNSDPADNFGIGLEYCWLHIGDTIGNTTIIEREVSTGVNQSGVHQTIDFDDNGISDAGSGISSIFVCRFYRLAATTDNYLDPIIFTDLDIHYEIDTIGSEEEYTK